MSQIAEMKPQEAEESRWQMLNRQAEENMRILTLKLQQFKQSTTETQRNFLKQTLEQEAVRGAEKVLRLLGLEDGEGLAKTMGPKGVGNLLLTVIRSKAAGVRYWFHFDPHTGQLFAGNHQTGQVTHRALVDRKTPVEKRTQARNQMLSEYDILRAGSGMLFGSFDDYVASPEGQACEAFLLGLLTQGQYDKLRQQFTREAEMDEEEARALRKYSILIGTVWSFIKKAFLGR
ncbi:MAG: hypothetical protein HY694_00910 [Deltaproteobacteria bacterium]|nr:hypothetical protein [Deltaproteobacteria bacterium]